MDRCPIPTLILVTNRHGARMPLPELASHTVAGGVDAVLVREKDLATDELRGLTESVVGAVSGRAQTIVNGDIDVAAALNTGLHLPEAAGLRTNARSILGTSLIGRSIHGVSGLASTHGCDYVLAGHVFSTPSKANHPPLGLSGLANISRASHLPVIAIGGITPDRVADVMAAGVHGIAVMSALNASDNPTAVASAYARKLKEYAEMHQAATTVSVTINGRVQQIAADSSIRDFLALKGFHERLVVVEVNGTIVRRPAFPSTNLQAGDTVEIVHFVGGG